MTEALAKQRTLIYLLARTPELEQLVLDEIISNYYESRLRGKGEGKEKGKHDRWMTL
jgi:hypothetical protein